jgi:predicted CxxxxCH...CXXCH cytochrome family protein
MVVMSTARPASPTSAAVISSSRLALGLAAVLLGACGQPRDTVAPSSAGGPQVSACVGCHGDPQRTGADPLANAAPPVSPSGSTTGPGVGAHLAHLYGGALRGAVACKECHVVPTTSLHANGQVEVRFTSADFAVRGGATPRFDPATASCSTTYCHGATLAAGGTNQAPTWNGGPSQAACGTCHGAPPPSHAATSTSCTTCHPGTVKPDGTIDLAGGFHVNGSLEVVGGHPSGWADPNQHGHAANAQGLSGCRSCHGAALDGGTAGVSCASCHGAGWQSNCTFCHGTRTAGWSSAQLNLAAPPLGTQGQTAATDRAVGAHQKHLSGGSIGPALACAECHTVPADLAHLDGTPTITFGAAARRGGASPAWTGVGCQATYCHGSTLTGGSGTSPAWTGGAAQAACGTCHGIPPSTGHHGTHSGKTICGDCHPGYGSGTVNLATHVDGSRQVGNKVTAWNAATRACTGCHGPDSW